MYKNMNIYEGEHYKSLGEKCLCAKLLTELWHILKVFCMPDFDVSHSTSLKVEENKN